MSRDYYAVLGVSPGADDAQIRKAFRALSRRHHPDVGGDEQLYRAISVAYAELSDPSRRRGYDAARSAPAPGARAQGRSTTRAGTTTRGGQASSTRSASSNRSAASSRSAASAGPGLRDRPVRVMGEGAERSAARIPVHGELSKRGLLDRGRAQREALLRELLRSVSAEIPAARLVMGVRLPHGDKYDAVMVAGTRMVVLSVLPTPDVAHSWDGSTLRVGGKVATVPQLAAAATALERAVLGSRAEGQVLLYTTPVDPFRPVVDQVGPRGAAPGPLNLSKTRAEITTFLAGGSEADAVHLGILGRLMELSATRR